MSRPRKGPRLYLRAARRDRAAVYVIIDGSREIGTGCGADRAGDAEAALAAYLAAKYTPPRTPGAGLGDILIADVMTAYLREHAAHTASAEFIAHTAAPIIAWWGARTLADVRGNSCRDYVAWRTRQPVANAPTRTVTAATARHDLKTLRAAINHWHREHGPLPSVPAVTLPPPAPPRERWLTRDEAASIIRAARRTRQAGHIARVVLIGVYTGTRPGALLGLAWMPQTRGGWIDLDAGVLHRRGEGARRTKKRQPPARIPDRLLPHLRRWHRADMIARREPVTSVIHYGGAAVGKLRRSWATVVRAAGIADAPTPHVLRHTAATWMMQGGADMYDAAGYLGMSVQMLEDVYGHHHPDFQASAANGARGRKAGGAGAGAGGGTRGEQAAASARGTPDKPSASAVNERRQTASNVMKMQGRRR